MKYCDRCLVDVTQKYYTERKWPYIKYHIMCESIYVKYPEEVNYHRVKKWIGCCLGMNEGVIEELLRNRYGYLGGWVKGVEQDRGDT